MADAPASWKAGGDVAAGEENAARVVRLAAQLEPRPVDRHTGWDDVVDRYSRRRASPLTQVLAFAAAAACGALVVWAGLRLLPHEAPAPQIVVIPPPAPQQQLEVAAAAAPEVLQVPLPDPVDDRVGRAEIAAHAQTFVASAGSQWTRSRAGMLRLEGGHFEAKATTQQPQRLQTPEVTVVATNARFAMDVTEQGTTVAVFEGTAEISNAHVKATLHAGETRHWGAQEPAAPQPLVPVAVEPVSLGDGDPSCLRAETVDAQIACFAALAKGSDLKAQNALFQKAGLEEKAHRPLGAAESLRESLRRFPDGALAPEVRLQLMRLLASEQEYDGAIEAGRAFLKAYPEDPRDEDVKGFVSRLEWLRAR